MEKAHNNIKTLMANLDVTIAPVQVKESAGNLMFYQHEAHDGENDVGLVAVTEQRKRSLY